MSLFQQIGDNASSPLKEWGPPVAALVASACAALLMLRLPFLYSVALSTLFLFLAGYVGMTVALIALVARKAGIVDAGVVLRFAAFGIWFLPVVFAIDRGRLWSIAAAGLLAAATAKLLAWYRYTVIDQANHASDMPVQPKELFLIQDRALPPAKGALLIAACAAHLAILSLATGRVFAAALLASFSCFLIVWRMMSATELPPRLFLLTSRRLGIHVILVILLIVCGRLKLTGSGTKGTESDAEGHGKAEAASNLHSGAILLPEVRRHVKIVAPRRSERYSLSHRRTLTLPNIPFTGEYWFSSFRGGRPSESALIERGSPIQFKFTASGRSFLWMQARQRLERPVEIRCCSGVELFISNADLFPGTVSVEFILLSHADARLLRQSLGEVDVVSLPRIVSRNASAVNEVLRFAIPAQAALHAFDEIEILFHLRTPRMQRSANIAVDAFRLVPRRL